jgi:hypothetical protein
MLILMRSGSAGCADINRQGYCAKAYQADVLDGCAGAGQSAVMEDFGPCGYPDHRCRRKSPAGDNHTGNLWPIS